LGEPATPAAAIGLVPCAVAGVQACQNGRKAHFCITQ